MCESDFASSIIDPASSNIEFLPPCTTEPVSPNVDVNTCFNIEVPSSVNEPVFSNSEPGACNVEGPSSDPTRTPRSNSTDNDESSEYLPIGNDSDRSSTTSENESTNNSSLSGIDDTNEASLPPIDNSGVAEKPVRKRARKGAGEISEWIVVKNKNLREKGLPYLGIDKTKGKPSSYSIPRAQRELKAPCNCAQSKKTKSVIRCGEFSEIERKTICEKFWDSSWAEKRTTVKLLTERVIPKDTKNRKNKQSRRTNSFRYYLKKEAGLIRVCKKQFLNTLSLKEWSVLSWNKDSPEVLNEVRVSTKRKARTERKLAVAKDFLHLLQKVPSHYCRKRSQMVYLETLWLSKHEVWRAYLQYCKDQEVKEKPYKFLRFSKLMDELMIKIFKPRKDQCDECVAHKNGNVSDEVWDVHRRKKDEARKSKENDKENSELQHVYTMDLEAVMVCPRMQASSLYFRMKLVVHNFTLYNVKTKDGHCFMWDESEAETNSNVFAMILCKFIANLNVEPGATIILWSDGCNYQNRNTTLSNAFLNLAQLLRITIIQKYLERGHTQMECDSMHSKIEKRLKHIDITLPSGYMTACRQARTTNPYHVEMLTHRYFLNFAKNNTYYKSIRPGFRKGDAVVCDLRQIKYVKDGDMFYKLGHSDTETWKILPQRRQSTGPPIPLENLPRLYNLRLPIVCDKFQHLQLTKAVLPADTHPFYDTLPHK
jgi:hypothetical protein